MSQETVVDLADFRRHEDWAERQHKELLDRIGTLERQVQALINTVSRLETGHSTNGRAIRVLVEWMNSHELDRTLAARTVLRADHGVAFLRKLGEIDPWYLRRSRRH